MSQIIKDTDILIAYHKVKTIRIKKFLSNKNTKRIKESN
jgi:hypothetical protein